MTALPPRRPTLGVDLHVWDGIFQGSRSHLIGLYRAAIRQAPDIDFVFFLEGTDSLRSAYPEFGASHVKLVRMRHRPAVVRLAVQLPWIQWRHRLDLLHMQYRLPFVRLGACACTIHDVLFETHPQFFEPGFVWQSRISGRMAVRSAKLLFAVSQFSKAEMVRLYGVAPGDVAVTYNGVDRQRFRPGDEGRAAVERLGLVSGGYILSVGRLEPRKNHETLVRAYASLGPEVPPLAIVGQRDFSYGGVFDAIASLGLEGRVKVLERVDDDTLPALMRHALVFAYPAFAEGFGMPVAEAMASGVPVVTSNTTSLPEVAGAGALLVDPHSADALAAALRQLLGDSALRASLVAAGLAQVHQFDWEQSAGVLLAAVRASIDPTRRT
jgi:glycosyltransferase involved in cell wall biosynthesis